MAYNSWAAQIARSITHAKMMYDIALDDLVLKHNHLRDCTGTQSAREGPAKPSLVSPTLTPCSKHVELLMELKERYLTLLDWDFSYKEAEEFLERVKASLED